MRGKDDQRITIGTRAASKLLVQVARVLLLIAATAVSVLAQPAPGQPEPFAITDNSLLVEEAFNQEAGVVQNMVNVHVVEGGNWETGFTQEWPLLGHRHQLCVHRHRRRSGWRHGFGDTQLHYRYQTQQRTAADVRRLPRASR